MTSSSAPPPSAPPESSAPGPSPKSWTFWRRRLARALLVGGVAVAAVRLAPTLPRDQHLSFVAPNGSTIRALDLTWSTDGTPVGGAQLRPSAPAPRLEHHIRVPPGRYTLEIEARLSTCSHPPCEKLETSGDLRGSEERTVLVERTVELDGETTHVTLSER